MMDTTDGAPQGTLVDLSDVSLADLQELDQSVFAHSLRRILDEIDRPQEAVAGWNSAM
ncbi:FxSxx-COOH cyclophane-containing RiPP peptide [Micromonospora zamorensis]|jgi:FXSXX-COOH protein|uniref:FXSXX-COOH protein n=2 Tax=Micromonospora TaxID=1873 RepID=A0A7Z0BH75_9ACTN|nr:MULTISPECIES: FxSxx-COOH cyclophane-containing RiPP peptide [Micromonospora]MBQ0976659.1 FXSXX-COOH protein [Micromonospora sp. M61]MBQ1037875.1 FXSXX-COOH protein [Micromonospora sp. C81]NYH45147.1 FXSXX-COOH protein [Micromonospora jinlongensis]TQJ20537.1 FXSXX-COOH protein [Micromonospora sp. A202]WSK46708.1 FxSxx-COOH protein [Micromonospora zamorensis]